jgi:hypothetical protein
VSSPPLFGINPGALLQTFANKTSDTTARVSTKFSNASTVLDVYLNGPPYFQDRHFNWADVTLEVYNVPNCSGLSSGNAIFSNLQLWNHYYNPVPFPNNWVVTSSAPCGGVTTVGPGNSISIKHTF